jgi:methionyl-tRNA formyltransferase
MPRFAFFGTPYVARDTLATLLLAGYVPAVVVTSPPAHKGRGLALEPCDTEIFAREQGLPVLTPVKLDAAFLAEIRTYACEYAVVVAYGKLLPQAVLDAFPKGVLNVHYSLLPKYRGASPVESALRNGETVTGVTVQRMALAMDAGDILAQREEPILPEDTTLTLRPRLIALGSQALIDILPAFVDGTAVAVPQDHALATRAPKILKPEGELLLSGDPLKNWTTYRALAESPGTFFYATDGGRRIRVKIVDAAYANGTFDVRRIVPEGKPVQDFSYLERAGYRPE